MQGKTRITIGMVLLFLSGIAVGFFGSGLVLRQQVQKFVGRGPAAMPGRLVQQALRDIDLSPEQREQVEAILAETEPELRRIAFEYGTMMRQAADEQFERIRTVLRDDQLGEFEQSLVEIRRRFEKMRGGHHRRRPGPPRGAHPGQDPGP